MAGSKVMDWGVVMRPASEGWTLSMRTMGTGCGQS